MFTKIELAVRLPRRITKPSKETTMAKMQKDAAMLDLFDNGAASQVGERQADIEDIIFEKSLLAMVQSGDQAGQEAWSNAAKAGQVMRIC